MQRKFYILDENKAAVPAGGLREFLDWACANHDLYIVADDWVNGDVHVNTGLIGIDRSNFDGPPKLFETMVSGGKRNGERRLWTTWDEAVAGHAEVLAQVKGEAGA